MEYKSRPNIQVNDLILSFFLYFKHVLHAETLTDNLFICMAVISHPKMHFILLRYHTMCLHAHLLSKTWSHKKLSSLVINLCEISGV